MQSNNPALAPLLEARDALIAQRRELDQAIEGVDALILSFGGPPSKVVAERSTSWNTPPTVTRHSGESVTAIVIDMLIEAGTDLDAATFVAELPKRGATANEHSIRSMLPRMVRRGQLVKRGRKYGLPVTSLIADRNSDSPTTSKATGLSDQEELARGGETPDVASDSDHRQVPRWDNGNGGHTAVTSSLAPEGFGS